MRFGQLEIGPDGFGFAIIPTFFFHKNVSFDDDRFADEVGVFWFGMRVSFFYNLMTWTEMNVRRAGK